MGSTRAHLLLLLLLVVVPCCCRQDAELQASAAAMLQLYRTEKQALIHNDLHAGGSKAAAMHQLSHHAETKSPCCQHSCRVTLVSCCLQALPFTLLAGARAD